MRREHDEYLLRKNAVRPKRGCFETMSRQASEIVVVATMSELNAEIAQNSPLSGVILGVSHSYNLQCDYIIPPPRLVKLNRTLFANFLNFFVPTYAHQPCPITVYAKKGRSI